MFSIHQSPSFSPSSTTTTLEAETAKATVEEIIEAGATTVSTTNHKSKMSFDYTSSAISCAADFSDTAMETFRILRDVVIRELPSRTTKAPAAKIEMDYDGDDITIISEWTEVESVVIVHQPSRLLISPHYRGSGSSSSSYSPVRNRTTTKRRGRTRKRD